LSQSLDYRAGWAYNHRYVMDDLRYRDLLAQDANLAARVHALEVQNAKRDPLYAPPGVDPDLMYTDDYVAAAVNPTVEVPPSQSPSGFRSAGRTCCIVLLVAGIILFSIWFIFIKRWNA